jgi:hypothetical protein
MIDEIRVTEALHKRNYRSSGGFGLPPAGRATPTFMRQSPALVLLFVAACKAGSNLVPAASTSSLDEAAAPGTPDFAATLGSVVVCDFASVVFAAWAALAVEPAGATGGLGPATRLIGGVLHLARVIHVALRRFASLLTMTDAPFGP